MEKAREFQKIVYFCSIQDFPSGLDTLEIAEQKDVHSPPVRTLKLPLAAEQPSTGECWIPPKKKKKKKHPMTKDKGKAPTRWVGGAKLCLESNRTTTRDTQRAQTSLVCTRGPETTQRVSVA